MQFKQSHMFFHVKQRDRDYPIIFSLYDKKNEKNTQEQTNRT